MSEPQGPRLVAVPPPRPEASAEPAPPEHGLRALRGLVVLALLGVGLYGAWQARRAAQLEDRVAELGAALSAAEAEVAAHREHLVEVRQGVSAVQDSLSALQGLVARDPTAPAAD